MTARGNGSVMLVNAEVRDREKMSRDGSKLFIPLVVVASALMGGFAMAAVGMGISDNFAPVIGPILGLVGLVIDAISVIILIPLSVYLIWKANGVYENSWATRSFDFSAKDRHIYYENRKMHVNVCSMRKTKIIYVHDMGDYEDPYAALFYATIQGEDAELFYDYLRENNVVIEKEKMPKMPGRYGLLAPLRVSQYRRR